MKNVNNFENTHKKSRLSDYFIIFIFILVYQNGYSQSWIYEGMPRFSSAAVLYPSIDIDHNGTPYVVYSDDATWPTGNIKTTVMKYNGIRWENVGRSGFSAGTSWFNNIVIDTGGTPYVSYSDGGMYNYGPATVMKFTDTGWAAVGRPWFSAGATANNSLAIDKNGIPYVVYQDDANGWRATVMKFVDTGWVSVDTPGFTTDTVIYTSIAIDSAGTPYIVFFDWAYLGAATVMKYNGTHWEYIGSPGFSIGEADYTSIAIDRSGTPYVVYSDWRYGSGGAAVMKYNGTTWEYVGADGFSAGTAYYTSIVIDSNGSPYVAYGDSMVGGNATVMKFDGRYWQYVGSPSFADGLINNPGIALYNNVPYIVYGDNAYPYGATVMRYDSTNSFKGVQNIKEAGVSVFPNPATADVITIAAGNITTSHATISICSIAGSVLLRQEVNNINGRINTAVNVHTLPAGLYFVTVKTDNEEYVAKMVKE